MVHTPHHLLYDPLYEETVPDLVEAALPYGLGRTIPYVPGKTRRYAKGDRVFVYCSEEQLLEILPWLSSMEVGIILLPHPESAHILGQFSIEGTLEEVLARYVAGEYEVREHGCLYVNGALVWGEVVFGDGGIFMDDVQHLGWWQRWKQRWYMLHGLSPMRVDITLHNGTVLNTALVGSMIALYHPHRWWRHLLPVESHAGEGMLHGLLFMPRSVVGLGYYVLQSLWIPHPALRFGAYVRTQSIILSRPGGAPMHCRMNGQTNTYQELHCVVAPSKAQWYREYTEEETETVSELYKVQALPPKAVAQEMSQHPLPFWRHASAEEFKELFRTLRDNAVPKSSYMVLMVLATLLATFGLLADSAPVVIGAMILAPLMGPIVSLSMGVLRQDKSLASQSVATIVVGMGVALLFAVVVALLVPISLPSVEILSRTRPHLLDLAVAVVSGIAGAYGYAREEVTKTLAGVAIAVALVPPLAVVGIGVGWGEGSIALGALLLLTTNLAGIVLAAALTFFFLGFSPLRPAAKGLLGSLVVVLCLMLPLGFGFRQMQLEHQLIQQLEGKEVQGITLREVQIYRMKPVHVGLRAVAEAPLTQWDLDILEQHVQEITGEEVRLEVSSALLRP